MYDSFGRLVREVDYNATGVQITSTDPAAVDTLFGYTSRLFDPHTGLQYNRERWYDPFTGRWISQDPIDFAGGDANLYRYVGNGPVDKTDPSGMYGIDFHFYAPEGGHYSDNPYNDVEKALEAAKTIYGLIPRGPGKHVPWHILEPKLRAAFSSPTLRGREYDYEKTTKQQVEAMKHLIKSTFQTECDYKMGYFMRNRNKFMTIYYLWICE